MQVKQSNRLAVSETRKIVCEKQSPIFGGAHAQSVYVAVPNTIIGLNLILNFILRRTGHGTSRNYSISLPREPYRGLIFWTSLTIYVFKIGVDNDRKIKVLRPFAIIN